MLPKQHRLNRAQFGEVFSIGSSLFGGHFSVKWINSREITKPQFAVVVSKKVSKSSVRRHRVRRRCYEVVRELLPHVKGSARSIIFARSGVTSLSFYALREELRKLFVQAGIISK